jgi:hypothetical protein
MRLIGRGRARSAIDKPLAIAGALAVTTLAVTACGTEPNAEPSGTYYLAAVDSLPAAQAGCFAILNGNVDATPYPPCAYLKRAFEATFDSSGASPALVLRAAVLSQSGDTSTWQLRMATTVKNGVIVMTPGPDYLSLKAEQTFLLPVAGTLVDGVLTLQMPDYGYDMEGGGNSGPVYGRPRRTMFMLTASGAMPPTTAVAPNYAAVAFAEFPASWCDEGTATVPGFCTDQAFTLTRSGSTWSIDYQRYYWRVVRTDTLGASSLHIDSLPLVQRGPYVALGKPLPPIPPPSAGGFPYYINFSATGSVVGTTLTLFPLYESSFGTNLPNPVILKVQ